MIVPIETPQALLEGAAEITRSGVQIFQAPILEEPTLENTAHMKAGFMPKMPIIDTTVLYNP